LVVTSIYISQLLVFFVMPRSGFVLLVVNFFLLEKR